MKTTHRKTLLIDKRVQYNLAGRVTAYWLLCLFATFFLTAAFPLVVSWCIPLKNAPTAVELFARTWLVFWPAFVAAMMILPAVLWDSLRISNRFVGPMYRMGRMMDDLLENKPVTPINLRKGDYLTDFAEKLNRLAERTQAEQRDQGTHDHARATSSPVEEMNSSSGLAVATDVAAQDSVEQLV